MTYSNHWEYYPASRYATPYSIQAAMVLGTLIHRQLQKEHNMTDEKPPAPIAQWGFTAKPDFARICRELAESGASVGRVSTKGSAPVTLVRSGSAADQTLTRKQLFASYVTGAADWFVLSGDHVAALLEPRPSPVRVEAFGLPPAGAPPAPPAPPVAPRTVRVQHRFPKVGQMSTAEYLAGAGQKLEPGFTAFLGVDGRVYDSAGMGGVREAIGTVLGAESFGVFDLFGPRSARFPGQFASMAEANQFLRINVPYSQRDRYSVQLITDPVAQRPAGTTITTVQATPEPKFGIFTRRGDRSADYPTDFASKGVAEYALAQIPPHKRRNLGYRVRQLDSANV
jgi:hypothetical protein